MSTQTYTQCLLVKGSQHDNCWIPTELARVGKTLKVKLDGRWDNGWVVRERYTTREATDLAEHERDHLHQREASDI